MREGPSLPHWCDRKHLDEIIYSNQLWFVPLIQQSVCAWPLHITLNCSPQKKNGNILSHSADAKIGKTEGRDRSVCVEVRRRRSADGGHIYWITSSQAHHMAFIHLTNDMKNNKCSLFTIVGPSGGIWTTRSYQRNKHRSHRCHPAGNRCPEL